jgi:cell division septation protein DedD
MPGGDKNGPMPMLNPPLADSAEPPSRSVADVGDKKRIPVVSIPATISIGLLIAAVYLGGRIFTATRPQKPAAHTTSMAPGAAPKTSAAPPSAVQPQAPEVATAAVAQTAAAVSAAPETTESSDDGIPMVTPHSGQRYIQVGALDHDATLRFIQRLREEKLDPHVAKGPTPELNRVLIGPFQDRDALNEKKAQLENEGIDTFVREY